MHPSRHVTSIRASTAQILSTDDVPMADRAPMWAQWIGQHFGGLQSDVYGNTQFEGHLHSNQAGTLLLTRLEALGHRVVRPTDIARSDDEAYFKIVAPLRGHATVEQNNRQTSVGPGQWAIYDTTRQYLVTSTEYVEHLVLRIPHQYLRGLRMDTLIARPMNGRQGIGRVALSTLRSTFEELPCMGDEAAQGAGTLLSQLVRLSLMEESGQHTAMSQREALKDRIRSHIALHLRDPDLSVAHIAKGLHCSKRHLYNAMVDEPYTLANYIQEQRLDACLYALEHANPAHHSITAIAMHWGFSNLSHFSRIFRARTGVSPREFRQSKHAAN